jgi:hypothetical protein
MLECRCCYGVPTKLPQVKPFESAQVVLSRPRLVLPQQLFNRWRQRLKCRRFRQESGQRFGVLVRWARGLSRLGTAFFKVAEWMGSRVVAGMGRGWMSSAAVEWMESEVVRVAVHDSSQVCGSRQDSGSQAVMKEPQCGRLSQNAWAERAASVETQHRIADSSARHACRGRTGPLQRSTPPHSRRRLSSGADARRSESASRRRVSVQGNPPCSRALPVSRPLWVITSAEWLR